MSGGAGDGPGPGLWAVSPRRVLAVLLACAAACGSPPPRTPGVLLGGIDNLQHDGPLVALGAGGSTRYVPALLAAYDSARAMELVSFADRYAREPANHGYAAVLERIEAELRALGFGSEPGLQLESLGSDEPVSAWAPLRARLGLRVKGGERELLGFDAEQDPARTMLPVHAPSCDVEGPLCFSMDELRPGEVLVSERPLEELLGPARRAGAAAVLSSWLADYNRDPSGARREAQAIRYSSVPEGTELAVANISPAARAELRAAPAGARVHLTAEVLREQRPLRHLVATIVGERLPEQAVAIAAHVQEPGAVDNASGLGGTLEGLRALVTQILAGNLPAPRRSLVFLFGAEMAMSRAWLASGTRRTVAAFSADMIGADPLRTGALALLERAPDPGALRPLPPDRHTAWGAGAVEADQLRPNALALIARSALLDVGLASPGWRTSEHPWEGGSDHDVFLAQGIPAVLLWHFPDFAYHTSLDRLENVDALELTRTSVALVAAALCVADPRPEDLERYLDSLSLERRLRLYGARAEGDAQLEEQWEEWFRGARAWLRALCLDLAEPALAESR